MVTPGGQPHMVHDGLEVYSVGLASRSVAWLRPGPSYILKFPVCRVRARALATVYRA
jgi:hypothetical protein